ncbi:hypothetical protein [Dactylosporangium sp. CA-139066]|uniref:hypothetical protein n=1 Tax=Dactylosporangium sp. CA-139066 TaxID=3239930 RepID=UPI003D8DE94F
MSTGDDTPQARRRRTAVLAALLAAGCGVLAAWHWLGWMIGALLFAKVVGVSALLSADGKPDEEHAAM